MSGFEVVGLISAIIGIVETIGKVSKALKDAKDLPQAFREVADRLPLVQDTLQTVENHISNDADEATCQAIAAVLEKCHKKALQLEELFNAVSSSDNTSRMKRYALAVKNLGKESRVELLAKGMMEDAHLLALNHAAQAATEAQVAQLSEAIQELSNIEPSLPEEDGISQTHYGSGDNIAGNKYGGNHYENSGSGTAYFGAVTQHVYPEAKTELSLSQLCLRSLAFEGMDSRPTEIKTAAAGTCEWLLQHKKYKTWKSCDRSLLWIKGKPGSGKSTLLRYARDNVKVSQKSTAKPLILSFFFNGRGTELQKTPEGLFRSLLCQFQRNLPEALEALEATFKQRDAAFGKHGEQWQWDASELRQYFELSLWRALETQPVLLFVDALDECGEENAQNLAEEFSSLLHRPSSDHMKRLRICFTCRHYPILNLKHALEICIEKENERDISMFVEGKLSSFRERTGSTIAKFISKHAEGVFLWAWLIVNKVLSLERERIEIQKIEADVRMVPQTLDGFYSEVTEKMNADSFELIECICFVSRPLSLSELRWAMILQQDPTLQSLKEHQSKGKYPSSEAGMQWEIQTLGRGLIEYKSDPGVVQFIHQSVKDFFVQKALPSYRNSPGPEQAAILVHYRLAQICLRYFEMKEFNRSLREAQIRSEFPFLNYALKSWIFHANRIPQDLQESFPWPLDSTVRLWFDLGQHEATHLFPTSPDEITLLHIISMKGWIGALRSILARTDQVDIQINAKDGTGRTPLQLAAQHGHTAILELLLKNGARPDIGNQYDQTPLAWAIEKGDVVVIELLLQKSAKTNYNYLVGYRPPPLPLPWMGRGDGGMVMPPGLVALVLGAQVYGQRREFWRTPLSRAAELGDKKVVGLLLRYNAQPNDKDKDGETPLSRAMEKDRKEVIQMLRESMNQ
ncbi:hypothetical protein FOQG_17942 [Fusarium oxysporum f. sp. raphani 54005]|uniref:Uncharacterized protein n=1 Tax=Fusarium oxysporum f. sp. raphani 54005 TaxID=1089458 RepID=X0BFU1_FUSOX|nr:hypothetical protein FOQG_17942 [Fusarium oxysporum f. sp. raphani 54005]